MDGIYILIILTAVFNQPLVYSCPVITTIEAYDAYIDELGCTSSDVNFINIFEDCEENTLVLQVEDDSTINNNCDDRLLVDGQQFGIIRIGDADNPADDTFNCFDLIKDKNGVDYPVLFTFIDVNEFPPLPVDVNLVKILNVTENSIGEIIEFQYMDPDATEVDTMTFSENFDTSFELIDNGVDDNTKTRSYSINTVQELDYEYIYSFRLDIKFESEDKRGSSSSTNQTFFIQVIDEPDMPPYFIQYVLYAELEEDDYSQNPTDIYTMQAIDGDFGINNDIRYSISGGNELGLFTIDDLTGVVSCNTLVDREQLETNLFSIEVEAVEVDQDGNIVPEPCRSTQSTNIKILDVNDNIPLFDHYEYVSTIDEYDSNQSGEKIIDDLIIIVQDFDEGDAGTYDLATDSEFARVNPASGNGNKTFQIFIQPNDMFDFEIMQNQEIIIQLTATEHEDTSHISISLLKLTLRDINDNSPEFDNDIYNKDTPEGTAIGSSIMTVNAIDDDVTDGIGTPSIVYSMNQCDDLDIDRKTGEITIADEFDYESKTQIECEVIAEDMEGESGSLVGESTIRVNITDVNDEIPQISDMPSTATVKESDTNYVVTNVSVYDPDTTADLIVSLAFDPDTPEEVKGWFELQEISSDPQDNNNFMGEIRIIGEMQRELDGQIIYDVNLKVTAEDLNKEGSTSQSTMKSLLLTITDVNDEFPYFDKNSNCDLSLLEEQDIGTLVCIAVAYDDDLNDNITYSISNSKYLSIDETNGEILISSNIDRDEPNGVETFDATVIATDSVGHGTNAEVTITVLDANDNSPVLDSQCGNTVLNVSEDASEGEIIVTINATDKDEGIHADLVYKIQNDYDRPPFHIDPVTGEISIDTSDGRVLDREKIPDWDLFVSVNDQCSNPIDEDPDCAPLLDQCTIHIIILDINDNDPRATEVSCNGYSCPEIPTEEFLRKDSEIEEVELSSFDPDEPETDSSTLTFAVVNMTDLMGIELVNFLFTAVTYDRFNQITNLTEYFCKLKATQDLTGLRGNYDISIQTCDGGDRCTTTVHPLKIEDSNDQKPIFSFSKCLQESNMTITMVEGQSQLNYPLPCLPDGSDITAEVYVDDADEGENSRVDLQISIDDSELVQGGDGLSVDGQLEVFNVSYIDGNRTFGISIKEEIDREQGSRYNLSLIARDNGSPERLSEDSWIFIIVQDVPEFAPYFSNKSQLLYIKENEISAIRFEEAIDLDNEGQDDIDKEDVFYSISGGADKRLFEIRSDTVPELFPKDPLDRESQETYIVQIVAYNGELPSNPDQSQFLEVTVMAQDVNDVEPYFIDSVYGGNIIYGDFLETGFVNDLVATFEFSDDDLNEQLEYEIIGDFLWSDGQSYANSFRLNPMEGNLCQILLNMSPKGTTGYCTFEIKATDNVGHNGTAQVEAFVVTSDYLVPFTFLNEVDEVKIQENAIKKILSQVFGYTCIIDTIAQSVDSENNPIENQTTLKAHFIREKGTKKDVKHEVNDKSLQNKITHLHLDNRNNFLNMKNIENSDNHKIEKYSENIKNSENFYNLKKIEKVSHRAQYTNTIDTNETELNIEKINTNENIDITLAHNLIKFDNIRNGNSMKQYDTEFTKETKNIKEKYLTAGEQTNFENEDVELELVPEEEIEELASDGMIGVELTESFNDIDLTLIAVGEIDTSPYDQVNKKIKTFKVLFGTFTLLLGLLIIILGFTYFNKTKKLKREIKSLTTNTFGSKSSDIDKIGSQAGPIPGSNYFASAGSNPLWTTMELEEQTNIDKINLRSNSVSSGDSALVYPEEYPQFKKQSMTPAIKEQNVTPFSSATPDLLNVSHLKRGIDNQSFVTDSSSHFGSSTETDYSGSPFLGGNFIINPLVRKGLFSPNDGDDDNPPPYSESSSSNPSEII